MPIVLKNCGIYLDSYDMTGISNEGGVDPSKEVLDSTAFGSLSKTKKLGIEDIKCNVTGLVDLADNATDERLFNQMSLAQKLMTIAPQTIVAGDVALFYQALIAKYSPSLKHGQLMVFNIDGEGHGDFVNGSILLNTSISSSGNGTGFELGEVSATQKVYGGLHVFAISGTDTPTLTGKIQSDAVGFGSPTDVISFTAMTAIGSQWAIPIAGANSDTWWRFNYTISGTNPNFTVLAVVGIQ